MKAHTQEFKENIRLLGRELNSKITYTEDNVEKTLSNEDINSITPNFQSTILKSAMRGLEIDSNIEIPKDTVVHFEFGVKVREEEDFVDENDDGYDYINYGDYIVKNVEKQEDTNSYLIQCYDFMLKSMIDYEDVGVTYPVTIRSYIDAICTHLGLVFKNASDTFANYDKQIPNELYLDSDGKSLDYTFRDVFDELSQVTASTICIDLETNEVELRYITDTIGKNLLNRDNEIANAYIDASGNIISGNGYAYSDLIPVRQTNYVFSGRCERRQESSTTNYNKRVHGYDEEGNWIKQITYERIEVNHNFSILTTINDSTIKYVRLSYVANDTSLQFEEGTEETNYEPFGLDKIDEEFLKDVNVNFGEKFGAINTIVLSRSAGADNVYYPSTLPENPIEYKISDNQIMNGNDRADYLPAIYNVLNGLEYYINDYSSTGVCYYDICDKYNVEIGENTYSCIMFNDEVNITQGLQENIYTDMPEETNTDYTKADKDDRKINQTWLMVDKQNGVIESLAEKIVDVSDTKSGIGQVQLENAHEGILHKLSISGQISLLFPQNESDLYGYPLVPSNNLVPSNTLVPSSPVPYGNEVLYPSSTLYPRGSILLIDDVKYQLDFDFLNYLSATVFDEFVYQDGDCKIIRRVGIDSQGNKYALDQEVIEQRKSINLEVKSNSIIKLKSFNSAIYNVEYLLENEYTDIFATQVDVNSKVTQTNNKIEQTVSMVADDDGNITSGSILLAINKDESQAKIQADKISLEGYTTINGGFNIDENGSPIITSGNISLSTSDNIAVFDVIGEDASLKITNQQMWINRNNDGGSFLLDVGTDHISNMYFDGADGNDSSNYNHAYIGTGGISFIIGTSTKFNVNSETGKVFVRDGEYISWNQFSLEKMKKNIQKYNKNAVNLIKNSDVYEFHYKEENDEDKKHVGFIIGDKYNTPQEFLSNTKESVDTSSLIGILVKAIQEQQLEIENLKKEMEELKNGFNRISK